MSSLSHVHVEVAIKERPPDAKSRLWHNTRAARI